MELPVWIFMEVTAVIANQDIPAITAKKVWKILEHIKKLYWKLKKKFLASLYFLLVDDKNDTQL